MSKTVFGFAFERWPSDQQFSEPPTERQIQALADNRTFREVAAQFWPGIQTHLLALLEIPEPQHNTKGAYVLLLEFWINAEPRSKSALEREAMSKIFGQGDLF